MLKDVFVSILLQVQGQGPGYRQDGAGLDGSAYYVSRSLLACHLLFTIHFRIYLCVGRRRKGKDKPVVKKALVDLDGPVFHEFARRRASWALEDAYRWPVTPKAKP